jgi:hypothetical protein
VIIVKFAPELKPVIKHATHDQASHGSWARGGSGLDAYAMYRLQDSSDLLVQKIYAAEENFQPQVQREIEKPLAPNRSNYQTREEYDKAYKEYSKKWKEYVLETTRNIQSQRGEKHLDGTKKGVENYIKELTSTEWFRERFGNGGELGIPKVALRDNRTAGSFRFGYRNAQLVNEIVINRGYSKNEPTVIHEIAHYATAISQTSRYEGHGVEFARNHIFIAANAVSPEYARGLETSYREAGIPLD